MTVYLDSVFFLNAAVDYFLCLLTARSAGIPLQRKRYFLAACFGGLYAVAVFLPWVPFLSTASAKIMAGLLITLIAYGGEERLLRLMLLFGLMSCVAAGMVLGLGLLGTGNGLSSKPFYLPVISLVGVFIALWSVLNGIFRPFIRNRIQGNLLPITISIAGNTCSMTAFWDTGNQLHDPIRGQPVLLVSTAKIRHLFPEEIQKILTRANLACPSELLEPIHLYAPELTPRLLPYCSVGCPQGLLLAIQTDWAQIHGAYYQRLTVALSPEKLAEGYHALWGGELKKGGRYERPNSIPSASDQPSSLTGDLLYRRK